MVYVLYNEQKIFGVYENIQILKFNCYVFLYEIFKSNKISRDIYFGIKKVLFTESVLNLKFLEDLMQQADIFIDSTGYEDNSLHALKKILTHIEQRFDYLEEYMSMDSRVTVTFPGKNALDNVMVPVYIEESWKDLDTKNFDIVTTNLKKYIRIRIEKMILMFGSRVVFGEVSDRNASTISIQVWPADIGNWNLPENSKIFGIGMAQNFKYQIPGVYGIVIDPRYGYSF